MSKLSPFSKIPTTTPIFSFFIPLATEDHLTQDPIVIPDNFVCSIVYSIVIAPSEQATMQLPHSIHLSGSAMATSSSPSSPINSITPTRHSSTQAPQLSHFSSLITGFILFILSKGGARPVNNLAALGMINVARFIGRVESGTHHKTRMRILDELVSPAIQGLR